MDFPNISEIKRSAWERVEETPNARRLILIYTAVPAALSLLLTALSYVLSLQIADTGGLGGLGTRSILETLQSMLQVVSTAFTVFWGMGYTAIVLRWSRGRNVRNGNLLDGFCHWGPVLRGALLKMALCFGGIFLAIQLSYIVYAMTPLSAEMMALMEKITADSSFSPTEQEVWSAMAWYLPFLGIGLAVVMVPMLYRLRMMDFALMDAPERGALFAMRMSLVMTRRKCFKLFLLDLRFWWFYLLEVLATSVYYGDVLLELTGPELGISSEWMLFVACAVGLGLQMALYIWRQNHVMTAYAMVYNSLKPIFPDPRQAENTKA